jgi:23S rRNA pseudouridine1911/1915/1917 synthase
MTPITAEIAIRVVTPEISISHRTLATIRAASGSSGWSSSANGLLMDVTQARSETLVVAAEEAGERLDRVLAARVAELSRSRHKALILAGRVAIDGATIRDPGHRVNAGGTIALDLPSVQDVEIKAENIPLSVVFEDNELIVLDKPAGLVVHPAAGNWSGTLVNALIAHCGDSLSGVGGEKRPGIVHRLDKNTSGLMVAAKTDRAHRVLSRQFADHGRTGPLRRGYLAFVWGVPDRPRGTIDKPIDRHPHARDKMAVREGGREALTHWEVLERYPGTDGAPVATLLACRLETGRTHQIRVHLASIGHPLLGDDVYGPGFKTKATQLRQEAQDALKALGRQALHAYLLTIEHPSQGKELAFRSELPGDLRRLRHSLGAQGTPA